jgi:molecular chaperone DnaK (HSP70)
MQLGIDIGTTRIVAALADRGNYPLVRFEGPEGEPRDWFPPLIAVRGSQRLCGWEAWSAQSDPDATIIGSIKALLRHTPAHINLESRTSGASILDLLTEVASAFHTALDKDSNVHSAATEPQEIVLGIPVNANSDQRFVTAEAFRRAGFVVLGLLEEPLAASLEFRHVHEHSGSLLIYHLGGCTFDAALVEIDGNPSTVVTSEGLAHLGGDDFDTVLAELAWEAVGLQLFKLNSLSPADLFWLHEECRHRKEALAPATQRIIVDLGVVLQGCKPVAIPVAAFYDRCRPLVDQTIRVVERLLSSYSRRLVALYVIGGGSELPLVMRRVREAFRNQASRAASSHASTAIGLAIAAAQKNRDKSREKSFSPLCGSAPSPAVPIPGNLDPEHWLCGFMNDAIMKFLASGGTITFDAVSNLLKDRKEAFLNDSETARRMLHTYPDLFKET